MEDTDGSLAERERFLQCFTRLYGFNYRRDDEASRTNFNLLLDEINSMEYYMRIVEEDEANRLIAKLCSLVPLYEERFLVKVCQAIFNFTAKQQLNLTDQTLHVVTEYLISALQRCQPWTRSEILLALGAVVYECCGLLTKYHDTLLNKHQGVLLPLLSEQGGDEDVLRGVIQCIENLTIKVAGQSYLEEHHTLTCFEVFMNILHTVPVTKMETNTQCKVLICSLRGLQNLLAATKIMPADQLGNLLAGVRTYMFHGVSSFPVSVPERLYPTPLSQYDTSPSKQSTPQGEAKTEDETQTKSQANKKSKKKKAKKSPEKSNKNQDGDMITLTSDIVHSEGQGSATTAGLDTAMDTRPVWSKISSSDSDYSDTEGVQGSRMRSYHTKVRQCALACLHTVIKTTDRRLMFGYWSSFIPDSSAAGNSPQVQTLFTIVLKDPSPKCRMGALAALTALVDGTKTFLAAAEDIDQTTAFTPFSSILGSTIRELHRCLLLALVSENYPLTLTQLIKCIAILISNVPYQRMKPGLLSRVIKMVRNFLNHRDPNVRVACLTCFGAVAAIQPPLMEICHIMQSSKPPLSGSFSQSSQPNPNQQPGATNNQSESKDSGISSNQGHQSSESSENLKSDNSSNDGQVKSPPSPGVVTPPVGSGSASPGTLTPVYSDKLLQAHARDTSWLIKLCMRNILPYTDHHGEWSEPHLEPLPVRLESLQVLAHLTKGYFPIIRNSLAVLRDLIHKCMQDSDQVVRLHTIKLLDVLTQVILQDVQAAEKDGPGNRVNVDLGKEFWIFMLTGPLPSILQTETNNAVRATSCDCISNVGPEVFAVLPMDKRILCITLVLGLTSDDDRIVRSAAVRAVGVYVLYPCLREDVSFIADAANSILKCMTDSSLNVRLKTAWSLANLCDALVLNKTEGDAQFLQDFSNMLLQKLFNTATRACQDSDKVRSNAVRALGNLMRYLPRSSLEKCTFKIPVEEGVKALVKNITSGTMKVRWNACYAVSNLFKNPLLNQASTEWMRGIILALCGVVKDCKNFKVRINAALALGSPADRDQYGDVDLFVSVWEALIRGLETAEEITDFAEYKYRGNLDTQIFTTILHLVTVTQYNDLDKVGELLEKDFDLLMDYLDKFQHSPLQVNKTEFETECATAQQNLALFEDKLSHRQSKAVLRLREIAFSEFVERERKKTAFVKSYD